MAAIGNDDESNRVVRAVLDEPHLHALYIYLITFFKAVFLNRRAAAQYRALASIIPGLERFSWNLSF